MRARWKPSRWKILLCLSFRMASLGPLQTVGSTRLGLMSSALCLGCRNCHTSICLACRRTTPEIFTCHTMKTMTSHGGKSRKHVSHCIRQRCCEAAESCCCCKIHRDNCECAPQGVVSCRQLSFRGLIPAGIFHNGVEIKFEGVFVCILERRDGWLVYTDGRGRAYA